jgi:hypothetical protein
MASLLALVLAFLFGGVDQYLGSFSAYPWAADISLLSAPWLVLPFVAGYTQRDAKRATLLGLGCTLVALVGYALMTLSPFENAHLTARAVAGFTQSSSRVIIGAFFTGPLFGWLGYRWRARRAWGGALVAAGALCLEPLARVYAGNEIRFRGVWMTEVAIGIASAVYVAVATRTATHSSAH